MHWPPCVPGCPLVQINVGDVDESGVYTQGFKTFTLAGYIRSKVGR